MTRDKMFGWVSIDVIYTWWALALDAGDSVMRARHGFMRSFGLDESEWYTWWPTISRGVARALEER